MRRKSKQQNKEIEYKPVSIVMPVLNNLKWTKQCIESVFNNVNDRDLEFIIIDNASIDGTSEYIKKISKKYPQIVNVKNDKNVGVAASWNQGIRLSKHDYVCIINNDIKIFTPDWLYQMEKILKNNQNIYWTSPRTCYSLDPTKITLNPSHYEQLNYNKHDRRSYIVACCFMCPKKIFLDEEIGFFDEGFDVKYYEDLDFIARILSANKKVRMCESVLIYHGVGKTSRKTSGGENNENYYQEKWGGTKYDILSMQPGRAKKGIKHFDAL